jgi:hypothetical protein
MWSKQKLAEVRDQLAAIRDEMAGAPDENADWSSGWSQAVILNGLCEHLTWGVHVLDRMSKGRFPRPFAEYDARVPIGHQR